MPFKVGDFVLIISGGFEVVGLRTGDTAVVTEIRPKGVYATGLLGTPAHEMFLSGLYFFDHEIKHVAQPEGVNMLKTETYVRFTKWDQTLNEFPNAKADSVFYVEEGYGGREYKLCLEGTNHWVYITGDSTFEEVTFQEYLSASGIEVGSKVTYRNASGLFTVVEVQDENILIRREDGYILRTAPHWLKAVAEEALTKYETDKENFAKGLTPFAVQLHEPWGYSGTEKGDYLITYNSGEGKYLKVIGNSKIHYDTFSKEAVLRENYSFIWEDLPVVDKALNEWGVEKFSDVSAHVVEDVNIKFEEWVSRWNVPNDKYFHARLAIFNPKPSQKVAGNIAIYHNKAQKLKGVPVTMKAGRAIRLMFPHLDDKQLALAVDEYRVQFPSYDYVVKESMEAKDFKHVYSHTMAPYENIYTTDSRKSLANSCMRGDRYHNMKTHPAEVYASGDFKIIWTELPDGRIGSRCVVYINEGGKPQAGPVYGTTEASIDFLVEELNKMGADLYYDASWEGARLKLVKECGGIVGPYLDQEQGLDIDGDYLVIGGGRYEACSYNGYISGGAYTQCNSCEDDLDEDDYYDSDHDNCHYCEHCYYQRFTRCEHDDTDILREDAVEVMTMRSRWLSTNSHQTSMTVHRTYTEDGTYVWCESREEYWDSDYTVCLHDGTYEHLDDAGECYEDNEYYHNDDLKECQDGHYRNRFFLEEAGWVADDNGLYYLPETEEESEAA